jgi:hypothetical protein
LLPDTTDIYPFLYHNKIGLSHSLLFVRWSQLLEAKGNYDQAVEVLKKGKDIGAQPRHELENAHMGYRQRRDARQQRERELALEMGVDLSEPEDSLPRKPLNRVQHQPSSHRPQAVDRAINGQTMIHPANAVFDNATAPAPSSSSLFRPNMPTSLNLNSIKPTTLGEPSKLNFQVFCDDEDNDDDHSVSAFSSNSASSSVEWNKFAPKNQIGKENSGMALPFQPTNSAPTPLTHKPTPSFEVYMDDECIRENKQAEFANRHMPVRHQLDGEGSQTLKISDASSAIAKINADPLRNMKK